ncbi:MULTISPECIES: ABC-F family ATP-binding cassette domain-containing protein [Spiribacter]|uniref:Probable ATP-binding protein YheS n=1 Tax=Spiribacter aquaticus TaxID=1935996 RepID=A0A557RKE9_9GAMM|nr:MULTISPECIES: ATP-binding cassette domain-containing protein [Spiribacter]AUB77892.1 ABC transporter ATP-binding protein [Spiribacter roseus]KAF0279851.1 ABC transporter ATP-binding protein [Spiribacter roseus]KAF0281542.1 ABC transporter ATP-binding protein [Spiribacter roseus]KAF0283723.1 ABC transporter ATP-binding protein [Spiribacter roseus]KAF0285994.1 ABC transporter ATP-binding protein [Spiribacter sp. SSL99]
MIQLRDITLRLGPDPLLEDARLTVHAGRKLGLVGANGTGKSTLFALLRGELSVDAGEVSIPNDWRMAWMAQETPGVPRPAIEYVLDGDSALRAAEAEVEAAEASGDGERIAYAHADFGAAEGYDARARAGMLLHGLGFDPAVQERPVSEFSGGWRVRLNLARALMAPSDLLLLDEPTNHLDLETVIWLEQWLQSYTGTLILIAHDRDFLDAVAEGIVQIEHRRLHQYTGGYSAFERQRAERLAQQQALYERQQREIAHMEQFIDRFRAKATKARAAQSRIKALERMETVAPAHVDSPFHFQFPPAPDAGNPLIGFEDLSLGYAGAPILSGLRQTLAPGDRIGLLGRNGAGKSTLIRALAGDLEPLGGRIQRARNLAVGYFAQHQLEQLDAEASPVVHLQRLSPNADPQKLRSFLGGFDFRGDQALDPVAPFSGGEKARLVLAMLVWQAPNLLLLDEPTNHLDLEMRHALNVALQAFEGAVVVVSHDRSLLESTVADYWLVADGTVRDFKGDLNDYRRWLAQQERDSRRAARAPTAAPAAAPAKPARDEARLRPLEKRVRAAETAFEAVDARLEAIDAQLADPALYAEGAEARLQSLLDEQRREQAEKTRAEAEWMAAEEALEAARDGADADQTA